MAELRQILSDKVLSRLPHVGASQYKERERKVTGFFVFFGKRRKRFVVQGEFWRDGIREFAAQVKLSDFGDLITREARSKAKEALGQIARGMRPGEGSRAVNDSITLRQAWARYRDVHMNRK